MTTRKSEQEPVPSGAHLAPKCTRVDCGGYRMWDLPNGEAFGGHCGCQVGRRKAESDYADSRSQPVPSVELAVAS